MTIDFKTRDEKLQYGIDKEAARISAISSGKTDKYKHLIGEEILSSDQSRAIEQKKFTYSPLGKVLKKQTKTIEDQGEKQTRAIEEHGKELIVSNTLITENPLNVNRDSIPLRKQRKYLMNFLMNKPMNLMVQKIKLTLINWFKTEGNSPKGGKPFKLSEILRDDDVHPKEVLKNQMKFKLDPSDIKKERIYQNIKKYNK